MLQSKTIFAKILYTHKDTKNEITYYIKNVVTREPATGRH